MNRRSMLTGAAVPLLLVAAPRLALAQTGASTGSNAGPNEANYKQMTLLGGSFALQASQLALQKASHPKVKEFAGFETAEQITIAQVLTDQQNPTPMPLDPPHARLLQALQSASGKQFDQNYIEGQIQGHQALLQLQQAFLHGQTDLRGDTVHVAMLARTVIQMHLAMLNDIASVVGLTGARLRQG